MKYFVIILDSHNDVLSEVVSNSEISLKLNQIVEITKDDQLLGYIKDPINQFRMIFSASRDSNRNRLFLQKQIDKYDGVHISEFANLQSEIERGISEGKDIVEISKEQYEKIIEKIYKFTQTDIALDDIIEKEFNSLDDIIITAPKIDIPHNLLVFGAPGTGKSYLVKELQEKYLPGNRIYERVTFYSNYSYAHFVGTYKPQMNGKDIVYIFVPGPFIRLIEKSFKNPEKNYLLIVEEINRANPAAVFGDMFQLLDRKEGKSEYHIETSEDLKNYLADSFVDGFDNISDYKEKNLILEGLSKLYIPSNLYIWATMNSADQGVFPIDTAFKRRWNYKYLGINDNQEVINDVSFQLIHKEKGVITINWNKLRNNINEQLSGPMCKVNEDKLIGPFFISNEIMGIDHETQKFNIDKFDNVKFIDAFKTKVIMYLYEDAAKQRRSEIFKGCEDVTKFSNICDAFDQVGIEIFGDKVASRVIEL